MTEEKELLNTLEGAEQEMPSVLMVDDELVVLDAFVDILEDEGYNLFTAENGKVASEILQREKIDIIVTDIKMPEMDGIEFLQVAQEFDKEIPVIMATAYASIESTVEAMRLGASNYLIKPIQIDLLRAVLTEGIAKRHMLNENRLMVAEIQNNYDAMRVLNEERTKVFEMIAQNLRQPLIDQQGWCELLMTDSQDSLIPRHLETLSRINSASSQMLEKVLNLLDNDEVEKRSEEIVEQVDEATEQSPEEEQLEEQVEVEETPEPIVEASPEQSFPDEPRSDFRVLLIEPSPVMRDTLEGALWRRYRVFSAADGYEGLVMVGDVPQLIVMELDLPRVASGDILRQLHKASLSIPVIGLAAPGQEALIEQVRSMGVKHVLQKPFSIPNLMECIEECSQQAEQTSQEHIVVYSSDADEGYSLDRLMGARYHTTTTLNVEECKGVLDDSVSLLIIDDAAAQPTWMEMVQYAQENYPATKTLVLTQCSDKEEVIALKKAKVSAALKRPYQFEKVLEVVRDLLGRAVPKELFESVYQKLS